MLKEDVRQKYLFQRKNISEADRDLWSQQISDIFFDSDFIEYKTFHVFLPIEKLKEINTQLIINELWRLNKNVIIPKVKDKSLLNCTYNLNTVLETNHRGISEPEICVEVAPSEIDVVIVPMLICDKQGNRIGYGGGFYDRFLPTLRKDVKLVGINYFEPIEHIDNETHDIPLDALITPRGIKSFIHL